jgi:molybdopterin synthase catalytic subunit
MISLVETTIDINALLAKVTSPQAGAILLFLGTTREWTDSRQTVKLQYDCYRTMALAKMEELADTARQRWQLTECAIVHRLGVVPVGEASVAIAVSAAHRQAAFEAGQWLIDTLKQVVPIWKQEHWADGTTEWVHPGLPHDETPKLDPSNRPL